MVTPRQHMLILGLVAVGAILVFLFGARTLRALREFRQHSPAPLPAQVSGEPETDAELIREWMTIPFIARMYRIDRAVLYQAIDISPRGNEEKSLTQLNEQYFPGTPGIVEAKIKAAVLEHLPLPLPTP